MSPNKPADGFSDSRSFPFAESDLETISCPLCKSSSNSVIHAFGEFRVVLCKNCGLYFLNPRMKESVMLTMYERGAYFFGEDASGYYDYRAQEVSLRLTFRRFLKNLRRLDAQQDRLLEVGSGYGFFLDEAKGFFSHRTGIELSEDAGREAAKMSGSYVHVGDVSTLPPHLKDFNVIVTINVIEHIYEPVSFLRLLGDRLAPGGKVVVATPDIGSLWYKGMKKRWPSFKIPEHVAFYDSKTLARLLETAGFQSIMSIPFPHAFPLGLIAKKIGLSLTGNLGKANIWLPKTMVALSGQLGRKNDGPG